MKNKKVLKLIALFAMICIMVNASALVCFATGESADIIVTIANKGAPVVYNHSLNVTDADNDGALTINDALILAHSAYYSEGAAGYETATTQWGLSITKLWGNTNKGSFGYYVNNVSAWSLTDPITDGDYLYAFCYKDAANYTDSYSYFNITEISSVVPGEPINLSLTMLGYDESWNTVQLPAAGAIITLDGVDTQSVTDETGAASIVINDSYQHIISARFDDKIITPAVIDVKGNLNHLLCNFSGNKYYYFNNVVQTGTSRYNGIDYVFGADGAMTNMQTDAYVTIANNGAPVVCYAPIIVNDADNDLSLTINDALICAHEQYYSDGVNGYESAVGQYGLGVTKLWGNTNKGSFGYYVNNVSAWSLTDNIGYCDEIYAFCYQDAANWTDSYSFFNSTEVDFGEETAEFTFTLSRLGYDENWNTVELPVANAIITFDGVDTEYVTDENGEVTLTVENTTHIISARSNDFIITPPVILVNSEETGREFTGDFNGNTYWYKDGVVQTGFKTVDGKNCYFGADGAMVKKQLVTINGKKYYFGKDGAMYTKRLISVSGKKYYMGADGAAYTKRLISVDGKKYYMGADGVAYTKRLISVDGKKYYMGSDGVAYTKRLISVDGKKYYMGSDGVAYTKRLISVSGKKYYMGKDGVAYKSKLISVNGKKYYIGKDCVAYKSKFASLSGKKYYFGSDCVMYKSKTFSVNGVKWIADKNGVCTKK